MQYLSIALQLAWAFPKGLISCQWKRESCKGEAGAQRLACPVCPLPELHTMFPTYLGLRAMLLACPEHESSRSSPCLSHTADNCLQKSACRKENSSWKLSVYMESWWSLRTGVLAACEDRTVALWSLFPSDCAQRTPH